MHAEPLIPYNIEATFLQARNILCDCERKKNTSTKRKMAYTVVEG